MELTITQLEQTVASELESIGFPLHELAAENVLAAIRLNILEANSAEQERRILNASILAGRCGLLESAIESAA